MLRAETTTTEFLAIAKTSESERIQDIKGPRLFLLLTTSECEKIYFGSTQAKREFHARMYQHEGKANNGSGTELHEACREWSDVFNYRIAIRIRVRNHICCQILFEPYSTP